MELKTISDLIILTKREIELIKVVKTAQLEEDVKTDLLVRIFPYIVENLMLLNKNGLRYDKIEKLQSQYRMRNKIIHRHPYSDDVVLERLDDMINIIEPKLNMPLSEQILSMPIRNTDKMKKQHKQKK
ncbi:MAG: hypothetical protein ATN35_06700 [Epulopiscium sp. Nele67-Bin004]|nr:MAG: hypothetical protein ATN35_06700 [Epulopiscium sp. Nele67-Bin004]